MRPGGDIGRLALEMETLWGDDLYRRPRREPPLVALALAPDGKALRFGPDVPTDLQRSLEAEILAALSGGEAPPMVLARLIDRLGRPGRTRVEGGPGYVFEGAARPPRWEGRIVTSLDGASTSRGARPASWGDPQEWADLLAGRLGPWAVGTGDDRVVSVCYTPVAGEHAAEAGIWTLPEARGRGWAAPVVQAWAHACETRFGTLFYSTSSDNHASQAVARKLDLRPLGTIWQLREVCPTT